MKKEKRLGSNWIKKRGSLIQSVLQVAGGNVLGKKINGVGDVSQTLKSFQRLAGFYILIEKKLLLWNRPLSGYTP